MTRAMMLIALFAVAMEPIAAVSHRFVMHAFGWRWHRSHHRQHGNETDVKERSQGLFDSVKSATSTRFELNDLYPLVFSAITVVVFAIATSTGNELVVWAATGVTLYGAAYLFVHDIAIHRRAGALPEWLDKTAYLRWVREAHRIHHLFSRAPYGFLCPVIPNTLRVRASTLVRDPLTRDSSRRSRTTTDATVATFTGVDNEARAENTS